MISTFEGAHCTVRVQALAPQVLLVKITGTDVGEHKDAPMQALERLLPKDAQAELFVDAREAVGPSTDVSAAWSQWLAQHRAAFRGINMLTGTRFVQLTATFVRKYADLGELMRIYTDPTAFETALSLSVTGLR